MADYRDALKELADAVEADDERRIQAALERAWALLERKGER